MKWIPILLFCFSIQILHAQNLTNTGFENWTVDSTGYLNPVDWFTSNGEEIGLPNVVQGAGRSSGYSAKLLSMPTDSGYTGGSLVYLLVGNYRPKVFSGYWKGTLFPGDYLIAGVSVFNSTFDHLAYGLTYDSVSIPDWIPFQVNIDSFFPGVAVESFIDIFLEPTSASSVAYVDDVALTYTTSTGDLQTIMLMSSTLNCESQSGQCLLDFDLYKSALLEISLFSSEGKVIMKSLREFGNGHYEIPVIISDLAHGIYFCRITGEGINKTYKLMR